MFRHNRIVFFMGAALAATLAACYPAAKPTSSVSTLSYQIQPSGLSGRVVDPSCDRVSNGQIAASPARAPQAADDSTNDPLHRLEMP